MKQIKQNKVREKQQQMKINADGNQISMSIVTSRIGKNSYISRVCVCDFFFTLFILLFRSLTTDTVQNHSAKNVKEIGKCELLRFSSFSLSLEIVIIKREVVTLVAIFVFAV